MVDCYIETEIYDWYIYIYIELEHHHHTHTATATIFSSNDQ